MSNRPMVSAASLLLAGLCAAAGAQELPPQRSDAEPAACPRQLALLREQLRQQRREIEMLREAHARDAAASAALNARTRPGATSAQRRSAVEAILRDPIR